MRTRACRTARLRSRARAPRRQLNTCSSRSTPHDSLRHASTGSPAAGSSPIASLGPVFDALRKVGRLSNYGRGPLDALAARIRLPLDRRYNEGRVIPDVRKLSEPVPDEGAGSGPHVMIVTLRVWQNHALTEVMLGNALEGPRRDASSILTCGGGLPICEVGWARKAWPRPCDRCAHFTDEVARGQRLRPLPAGRLPAMGRRTARTRRRPTRTSPTTPSMDYEKAGRADGGVGAQDHVSARGPRRARGIARQRGHRGCRRAGRRPDHRRGGSRTSC